MKKVEKEEFMDINFKLIPSVIWKEKVTFLGIILLILALNFAYVFSVNDEFISSGKILPEIQSTKIGGNLSQFAGLASLAGVDLNSVAGSSAEAIRPDLYPDIIQSTPFYLALYKIKVKTEDDREMVFEDFYFQYIEEKDKPDDKDVKKFKAKVEGIIIINRLNEERIKDLKERIHSDIDKKTGIITISSKMPDPVVAAGVSKFAMEYLTDYVTKYRTEKIRKEVDFLGENVAASRGKFYSTQEKKARYSDLFAAPTIRMQSADVKRERLESEYKLSSSFYNELLKKYEEAKIRLQQETPVFKTLDPPVAPTKKSEPKRLIITLFSLIIGVFFAFVFVLVKKGNYRQLLPSHGAKNE